MSPFMAVLPRGLKDLMRKWRLLGFLQWPMGFHGDKDGNIGRDAFRGLSLMTPVLLKPSEASGTRQPEAPRLLVPPQFGC